MAKKTPNRELVTFRDRSLAESGISDETQRSRVFVVGPSGGKKAREAVDGDAWMSSIMKAAGVELAMEELDRYQAGSMINYKPSTGDDMLMLYVGLDRKPMTYEDKFGRAKPFLRVRHKEPAKHPDKDGRPMKYQSPKDSGTFLWLPERIISATEAKEPINTLLVCEGEKKADKACQEGLMAVGISGIQQINTKDRMILPEFRTIIDDCQVKNVVFLLDSDLFDLSTTNTDRWALSRPFQFQRAVQRFRDYFKTLYNNGLNFDIWFGWNKPGKNGEKGLDDVLAGPLKSQISAFKKELESAINDPQTSDWAYFNLHRITEASEYQLKGLFHLGAADDIGLFYGKQILQNYNGRFKLGSTQFKVNADLKVELAQPLTDEETYWSMETDDRTGKNVLSFYYRKCYTFLNNRGFGRYKLESSNDYILVRKEGSVVQEIKPGEVKDFVVEFTEAIKEYGVLEMLYRGGTKYLGPESLNNLKPIAINLVKPNHERQYMFFKDQYWMISHGSIIQAPLAELPGQVWDSKVLPHKVELIPDFIKVSKVNGKYQIKLSAEAEQCQFFMFLMNTSRFNWRKYMGDDHVIDQDKYLGLDEQERYDEILSLLSKMTAMGYMLHRYRISSNTKAVIAMDAKMSDVGQSFGRSGKSLIGSAIEQVLKTVFIDGKRKDLDKDRFMLDQVDERTDLIWFDDIQRNFDFEGLFTLISGRMTIERKGQQKFSLQKDLTPKLLITTNHALSGESDSFIDRQILLGFSDFYNANWKPTSDFGVQFFEDWGDYPEQWNRFYNLMASCLQLYFQTMEADDSSGGIIKGPNESLIRRRMRQEIGEEFLAWADLYFFADGPEATLNTKINKAGMFEACRASSTIMRNLSSRNFKTKLKMFCTFRGYGFNVSKNGEDDKSNGIEWICISDEHYVPPIEPKPAADGTPF